MKASEGPLHFAPFRVPPQSSAKAHHKFWQGLALLSSRNTQVLRRESFALQGLRFLRMTN
jgi:hypothetical protein